MVWSVLCVTLTRLWWSIVWTDTSLDVSVEGFFFFFSCDEHLQSVDFKQIGLHSVGGPHPIS